MKTTLLRHRGRRLLALSLVACLGGVLGTRAASLDQFGYGKWHVPSTWNLLVILVTYSDSPNPPNKNTLDQRFFGGSPSVAGFFREASLNRFTFTKAATILVTLPSTQRYADWESKYGKDAAPNLYFSNFVAKAFASGEIDLAKYDTNPNDTVVKQGELDIVILSPPGEPGFQQPWVSVRQASSGRTWQGFALGMLHDTNLETLNHELGHHCQARSQQELNWGQAMDFYGRWDQGNGGTECINDHVTVMACRGGYFGAWERMRLGWCEPRVRSLAAGGSATIPAAQLGAADAPVLLYDPGRGTSECFLLEYRTPKVSNGSPYDQDVTGSGLIIWHAQVDANKNALWLADATLPSNSQENWRWCTNCYALFYGKATTGGSCSGGGAHNAGQGATDFRLPFANSGVAGEQNWNYCNKCQALFYGPNVAVSRCPAGGNHSGTTSGNYVGVDNGLPSIPRWNIVDAHWRLCRKCQSMFNAGPTQTHAYCPAGGQHDGTGSPNYDFQMRMQRYAVGVRGAPDLFYGSDAPWTGGSWTPPLRWYDGSQSTARIYVHPFEPGADTITVEWGSRSESWIDFAYAGSPFFPESGTFDQPYNTLTEGLDAVVPGGTVRIKSGHTTATPRITKPMRIEAFGGVVTLGH